MSPVHRWAGPERDERQAFFDCRMAAEDWDADDRRAYHRLARHLDDLVPGTLLVPSPGSPDTEMDRLVDDGTLTDGSLAVLEPMGARKCHRNAALLWDERPGTGIGTGYCLDGDGLWRQHSWAVTDGTVVETTSPRAAYFGVVLDPAEAEEFHLFNAG
jgi:hypothetical protein